LHPTRIRGNKMKKTIKFFGIIAIVVALGIGLSACGNAQAQGQVIRAAVAPERWEYKVVIQSITWREKEEATRRFNELGAQGWKLVSSARTGSHHPMDGHVFKRRLP